MWTSAHDAYLESRILSADRLELVRVLYETAIASIHEARQALASGEIAKRSRAISKACGILIELNAALDHSCGGEISSRLAALYQYMLDRLLEANLQQADAPLAEVLGLVSTLAEAWQVIRIPVEPVSVRSPWPAPQEAVAAAHAWSV